MADAENLSNSSEVHVTDFNSEEKDFEDNDEKFHDAVQFFKDPSSLNFLENAGISSAPCGSLSTRISLYRNFDPLCAQHCSHAASKPNELQAIAEVDVEANLKKDSPKNKNNSVVINKHLDNVSPRRCLGTPLMSFDSPVVDKTANANSFTKTERTKPQKLYTEKELQQLLKLQELSMQEKFLKRQRDLELANLQKEQEMEEKLKKQNILCLSLLNIISKEVIDDFYILNDKYKKFEENFKNVEKEDIKLQDLKASVEDVENTFSNFGKSYERCKNFFKLCSQNEDYLKKFMETLKVQLEENREMHDVLQTRTQEMLDNGDNEPNSKKENDAKVAVLKAQVNKAEFKKSSLRTENVNLSICDDLMSKVTVT